MTDQIEGQTIRIQGGCEIEDCSSLTLNFREEDLEFVDTLRSQLRFMGFLSSIDERTLIRLRF